MESMLDAAKSVSIYSVIQKYAPAFVRPKHTGSNATCPFHEDRTPSFHVYDKTNSFHCFSCGASGTGIDFVMRATGMCDPLAAAEDLCRTFGLTYAQEPTPPENKIYYDVYAYVESLFTLANTKYVFPNGRTSHDYWISRGVESVVAPYGLGYCPPVWLDKDKRPITFDKLIKKKFPGADLIQMGLAKPNGDCVMADRYTIPIRDSIGRTIAFSGRVRDNNNPVKYKNTPETELFKKREILWNWDKAKGFNRIFLVEGPLDALSLVVSGVKNVVSIMGSAITSAHLTLLDGIETVLAFDNDFTGKEKTVRFILDNASMLTRCLKPDILGASKDFNDVLFAGGSLASMVKDKNILYGAQFLLQYFCSQLDLSHLTDREYLYMSIRNLLEKAPYTDVAKDTIAAATRRKLGIKERRL